MCLIPNTGWMLFSYIRISLKDYVTDVIGSLTRHLQDCNRCTNHSVQGLHEDEMRTTALELERLGKIMKVTSAPDTLLSKSL